MCAPCGALGQACCSGFTNSCQSGLACSAMICAMPDAGGQ
jgi:hypothetical protein